MEELADNKVVIVYFVLDNLITGLLKAGQNLFLPADEFDEVVQIRVAARSAEHHAAAAAEADSGTNADTRAGVLAGLVFFGDLKRSPAKGGGFFGDLVAGLRFTARAGGGGVTKDAPFFGT